MSIRRLLIAPARASAVVALDIASSMDPRPEGEFPGRHAGHQDGRNPEVKEYLKVEEVRR